MNESMNWTDENIVFLISLPRSGSTLLQRILTAHPEIHTSAESWLLLPQFYALRQGTVFSEYAHTSAAGAISDFCAHLADGRDGYYRRVGELAVKLFADATPTGPRYYLEKTPRNNLVLDELLTAFPRSRIVFLWRNPLACAASIIETFGNGRWNLYKTVVDLYDGLDNMTRVAQAQADRIMTLRYETLLEAPEDTVEGLLDYLQLPSSEGLTERFADIRLDGRMGDPAGTEAYSSLSKAPLEKWKQTFASLPRRRWASRYLDWIGERRLHQMGYGLAELQSELASIPVSFSGLGSDLARMSYGYLERRFQLKAAGALRRGRRERPIPRRYY